MLVCFLELKESDMPGPKPQSVTLSARQRVLLERLARRQTSPQALVRRAEILLGAAAGEQNIPLARRLGCHREQVALWRKRWSEAAARLAALEADGASEKALTEAVAAVLADRPRAGRPATFTAEQICQILALACTDPRESEREVSHWTPGELAREAQKRGIVDSISVRQVGRFLERGG